MTRTVKGPGAKRQVLDGVYLTRYENLMKIKETMGGPTRIAVKLGHANGSMMSQIAGPHPSRPIGEKLARTIEQKLGYDKGYLDKPHGARPAKRAEPPAADRVALQAKCDGIVLGMLAAKRLKLSPEKMAAVTTMVLAEAERTGDCDPAYVETLLQIAT